MALPHQITGDSRHPTANPRHSERSHSERSHSERSEESPEFAWPAGSAQGDVSPPGYHAAYLHIDVTTGHSQRRPLAPAVLRNFLGGSGLGTHLLLAHGAAQAEPLSPAGALAFVFS